MKRRLVGSQDVNLHRLCLWRTRRLVAARTLGRHYSNFTLQTVWSFLWDRDLIHICLGNHHMETG